VVATKGALEQANLSPQDVDEVYYGNVMQAGQGQAPARQVCLGSGMKVDTPCTTINKVCSSGMKSVMIGASAIALGDRDIIVAGGMENMSKIPHLIYLRKPTGYGPAQITDGI
jgi:acetyl-CoA C-acetyltransferase